MNLLVSVGAAYVGICLLAWVFQSRLVFFPTGPLVATPTDTGLAFEDVWLETEDGARVHGWYVAREAARATVVFCHGNGGNVSHRLDVLRTLHGLGLATLIVDYPGYGRSSGSPSEESCYAAARAAERHVRALGAERVILWGRSLGGAVAAGVAAERPPDALVLESAFTSVPDMAREHYPWLPAGLVCRIAFDTRARIGGIACPKLFVHSRDDETVPFEHGEALFAAASEPKSFHALRGDHNGGYLSSAASYRQAVSAFLDEHFPPGGAPPGGE